MKYLSLLWLSALLSIAAGKEKRGRYVPVEKTPSDDKDHRALQSNNNRVTGTAFECNDSDFPLPESRLRMYAPGDVIKVCIKPEIRTEKRGIVMRAVDSANFIGGGSDISQKVIEFKKEAFSTLALCVPGQLVCSFRTKLQEELFWGLEGDEVNITGAALVTMEFIDESYALNGLADTDIAVGLQFLVRRIAPPAGVFLGGPSDGSSGEEGKCDPEWWCNYPLWFKILMIILAAIILCCCCAVCLTCPCMIREMLQDDREREERRAFVKEQKLRADRGSFQDYPEEEDHDDSYRSSSYRQQPPPPRPQGSYRQPPPPQEPAQGSYRQPPPPQEPARQSSYRVPRAENSSFRAQQRPSQHREYEY